tara:strand:- start:622 stop:747 length:126 start_codon:yes stop_codon:yes gene_type:complete
LAEEQVVVQEVEQHPMAEAEVEQVVSEQLLVFQYQQEQTSQ